jgi:hypothetical protein
MPYAMRMAYRLPRLAGAGIALTLGCGLLALPARAETPSLQFVAAYPYETSHGWQAPQTEFYWPDYTGLGVLLRLELAGYSGVRDVRVRLTAESAAGAEVLRHFDTLRLPAGQFEYLAPDLELLTDPFQTAALHLTMHAELEGGPAATENCDITVHGPAIPGVVFSNLRFYNPARKQNLTRLFPGDEFILEGEVAVQANPTPFKPELLIGGVLVNEGVALELAQPPAVNGLNWGRITLDTPAGAWKFKVRGRLPRAFPAGASEAQPFQLIIAVRWPPSTVVQTALEGQVLNPGLGFDTSKVPSDRLITLNPAWEWDIAPSAAGG